MDYVEEDELFVTVKVGQNNRWNAYRIMPNKRTPPYKRPPFLFMIVNYKELKEKFEVSKKIDANNSKKVANFCF